MTKTQVGNDGTLSFAINAGAPGSISLSATGAIAWSGELSGTGQMAGLQGGTLSISNANSIPTQAILSVSVSDLARFQDSGFDAVSLSSTGTLSLTGSGNVQFGRSLTLNAPAISGSGADQLTLGAPWVQVGASASASGFSPQPGNAGITLVGDWLDISGSVIFSGFNTVSLQAGQDMRLGTYNSAGSLLTAGNLTLTASRIYPVDS